MFIDYSCNQPTNEPILSIAHSTTWPRWHIIIRHTLIVVRDFWTDVAHLPSFKNLNLPDHVSVFSPPQHDSLFPLRLRQLMLINHSAFKIIQATRFKTRIIIDGAKLAKIEYEKNVQGITSACVNDSCLQSVQGSTYRDLHHCANQDVSQFISDRF